MNFIITGASRGLGEEFAKLASEFGGIVGIIASNQEKLKAVAENLKNCSVITYTCDFTNQEEVDALILELQSDFKKIDVLINNVGSFETGDLESTSLKQVNKMLSINFKAAFSITQSFLSQFKAQKKGVIINISSIYGLVGPDQRIYGKSRLNSPAFYSATKGALVNLTRYLAAYWHQKNIRVNTLTLGGVFDSKLHKDKNFVKNYSNKTMMGRMGKKEDFDGALLFLASDASGYVTGTNIVVDGGWTAW